MWIIIIVWVVVIFILAPILSASYLTDKMRTKYDPYKEDK